MGGYSDTPDTEPEIIDEMAPDWLQQQSDRAWQDLAALWGDSTGFASLGAACDGMAGTGYSCLREFGSWSRIRQLGLPVVLVLRAADPALLLLRGFEGDALLVGDPSEGRKIRRGAIDEAWLGEYLVAWPQAPGWPLEIRRGETGAAVDIVMQMAAFADPAWQGEGRFDAGFEAWLMAFQRRHGLKPDGIIGPNTLVYLMAPTITEPRLALAVEGER